MYATYALIRLMLFLVGLPLVIAVVIPWWLARVFAIGLTKPQGMFDWLLQGSCAAAVLLGVLLFVTALQRIVRRERDTLRLWDPMYRLDINGPYQHVRNPLVS